MSFLHPSRQNNFLLQKTTPSLPTCCHRRRHHRPLHLLPSSNATATETTATPAQRTIHTSHRIFPLRDRPADPSTLQCPATNDPQVYVTQQARILAEWMKGKTSILCLTGAGISTESGIPDYRGNRGSYFRGHKPIIHHEFMSSENIRKRYWARSLFGYSPFADARPNEGHLALASLERNGYIGVEFEVQLDDLDEGGASASQWEAHLVQRPTNKTLVSLSTITQNVDTLHSKAGSRHVLHLHGRGDIVKCMTCAHTLDRKVYHEKLRGWNRDWIIKESKDNVEKEDQRLRPDGDADWNGSYEELVLPPCDRCGTHGGMELCDNSHAGDGSGNKKNANQQPFYKTDVVFFGDSVPRHRVHLSNAAVDAADGLLCIGTSLAVHSAFRLAKRAIGRGVPVAILNVGETRLEREGLGMGVGVGTGSENGAISKSLVTKVESPIGPTLREVVNIMESREIL